MIFGKHKKYLFFFHNTDHYHEVFNSESRLAHRDSKDPRPTFYWFSDSFHNHWPKGMDKYIYLFVKNPKEDNIQFRPRHLEPNFNALYLDYIEFLSKRDKLRSEGNFERSSCQPPILMSYSNIVPDIIALYNEIGNSHIIAKPEKHKGEIFKIFDENNVPIPFNKIDTILKILPHIKQALPFTQSEKINGTYVYGDFEIYKI